MEKYKRPEGDGTPAEKMRQPQLRTGAMELN